MSGAPRWHRALARAVELMGGERALAAVLYTTQGEVLRWKAGHAPPRGVLLALAEINSVGADGRLGTGMQE